MDAAPAITRLSRTRKYYDVREAQPLDSGYVTQSTSPDSKLAESFPLKSASAVESKARPVPLALPPLTDLAEFDKSVDDNTLSRFRHVHTQIEKPLLAYIRSKIPGRRYRPIALRLMILGRNEDDAKPCIVAFCPEEQSKRVRKFFDKTSVTALCRPDDETVPSFNVFVLGRALETKHADEDIDIFIPIVAGREGYTDDTYCGAPILIRKPSAMERRCTFGGIIRTMSWDGDIKLYGLTVGHVLWGDSDNDLVVGTTKDGAEPLDNSELQLSDSESEDEPDEVTQIEPEETESLPAISNSQLASAGNDDTPASWASPELGKIGCISEDSLHTRIATPNTMGEDAGRYYDWALIEMEQHKPNRIRPRKLSNGETQGKDVRSGDLLMPVKSPCSNGKRQSVTLLSGSEGLKRGSLSPLPSRLLIGPGNVFVDTLVLNLDHDQQIQDGDSGSWVVNEGTLEVYGYVVAADSFGGGHVISLLDAFKSIGASLGLRSVGLATTVDMATAKLSGDRSAAGRSPSPFGAAEQRRHVGWARPLLVNDDILRVHGSATSRSECRPDSGYSSGIPSTGVSPPMPIPPIRRNLMRRGPEFPGGY
ncbi:hypothetical protein B0J15DRAFT_486757 [Fusarium solani]|uniref:Uncharacterized protein n=1 Tax=Fusarium solani TaxID=169388 RepID=A0A9P9KUA0_FUSSL|nr:uncharacterized protein B0J15DRAFT_486757 [Fusarium solani]KAH7268505.1 hypothetical protein B0J15DRAFT_486757 [Fusarium solani]